MDGFFNCHVLPIEGNIFEELKASVGFEGVCKGRQGTVLVQPDEKRGTPIVRTTTKYLEPAYCFQQLHANLVKMIQDVEPGVAALNNALIEYYNNSYFRMGFHSDQNQDLQDESYIAIFSCYRDPEISKKHPRKLVVRPKTKEESGRGFEIPMLHDSVVVWSTGTNSRFQHKIVLETSTKPPDNEWLGVTFRLSKTFVRHSENGQACFEDGTPLVVADEDQRKGFFKLRRCENQEVDFQYPKLVYTISPSDLMLPNAMPVKDT